MEMESFEIWTSPIIVKGGGELTTEQQTQLSNKFDLKCTTRPMRAGRMKEYPGQDTSDWKELTCYGRGLNNVNSAVLEALQLCKETQLAKEKETPEEQQEQHCSEIPLRKDTALHKRGFVAEP